MGILSRSEILKRVEQGSIVIEPFDPELVGPNSVDLHLGDKLYRYPVYDFESWELRLDPRRVPKLEEVQFCKDYVIGEGVEEASIEFWELEPGVVYLGFTKEHTETKAYVPYLDGRSSLGRLGVFAHVTAGRGDVGFCGRWTVEIVVTQPVKLYPGGRYFQITYHTIEGDVTPYKGRYQGATGAERSKISE